MIALTMQTLIVAASGRVEGATAANAQSPLGMNLQGIAYYSSENPFLNIFKTSDGWVTSSDSKYDTGEEAYLQLDSDGYPKTLVASSSDPQRPQLFTFVQTPLLNNLPNTSNGTYPAGRYIVSYKGAGTIQFWGDATLVSSSPGQYVINVANPTATGIFLKITATDPTGAGDYIRNIQLVKAENAAALASGEVFSPQFLRLLRSYHVLRFMDWLATNNSPVGRWASRPLGSNAFWGTSRGVPVETAIQLANSLSADAWLNVPHMADDNYIRQMATLVHSMLGSNQLVYLEYSNEVWNYTFTQAHYAETRGLATFAAGLGSPFGYNRSWYGMRVAQMCDIWKAVWRADADRVVCVLASQAANTFTATESLKCPYWSAGAPCLSHGIGAVAIAPYFGGAVPSAWTSHSDGGLTYLLASLTSQNDPSIPVGGWLAQASGMEQAYASVLASYKLPMLAYEAGQAFVAFPTYPNGSAMEHLFIAANRDPRMGAAYTTYLNQWKVNGGQLLVNFSDTFPYSQYGEWGALESSMQSTTPLSSAPYKWRALENFIATNSCWWSNCTGTVPASSPMPIAPADIGAQ